MMKFKGKEVPVSVFPKTVLPDVTFEQMEYIRERTELKNNLEVIVVAMKTVASLLKAQEGVIDAPKEAKE